MIVSFISIWPFQLQLIRSWISAFVGLELSLVKFVLCVTTNIRVKNEESEWNALFSLLNHECRTDKCSNSEAILAVIQYMCCVTGTVFFLKTAQGVPLSTSGLPVVCCTGGAYVADHTVTGPFQNNRRQYINT
jgi:hypothetical protein